MYYSLAYKSLDQLSRQLWADFLCKLGETIQGIIGNPVLRIQDCDTIRIKSNGCA